ncbi:MAG TPA: hypothetical protein PLM07_09935 [Candidatus Rifleibacterium sp.]|mgnify:CR=1 FL=1|nr:hypothetical protein [Candidatus Rifleibacterium sp.]HPT46207.1 hypothetical protein [Candidatus Rifleibacterium sp.]
MSLETWLEFGWIKAHRTSKQEIDSLFAMIERDLKDSKESNVSDDWKFGIAYNAALKLCTVLLNASGYRANSSSAHHYTIKALPLILGDSRKKDADYLDQCRRLRNKVEYDMVGGATIEDIKDLIDFIEEFSIEVKQWLKANHKDIVDK